MWAQAQMASDKQAKAGLLRVQERLDVLNPGATHTTKAATAIAMEPPLLLLPPPTSMLLLPCTGRALTAAAAVAAEDALAEDDPRHPSAELLREEFDRRMEKMERSAENYDQRHGIVRQAD